MSPPLGVMVNYSFCALSILSFVANHSSVWLSKVSWTYINLSNMSPFVKMVQLPLKVSL